MFAATISTPFSESHLVTSSMAAHMACWLYKSSVSASGVALLGRRVISRPPRRLAIGRVEQAWLAEERRAHLSSDAESAASLDT